MAARIRLVPVSLFRFLSHSRRQKESTNADRPGRRCPRVDQATGCEGVSCSGKNAV